MLQEIYTIHLDETQAQKRFPQEAYAGLQKRKERVYALLGESGDVFDSLCYWGILPTNLAVLGGRNSFPKKRFAEVVEAEHVPYRFDGPYVDWSTSSGETRVVMALQSFRLNCTRPKTTEEYEAARTQRETLRKLLNEDGYVVFERVTLYGPSPALIVAAPLETGRGRALKERYGNIAEQLSLPVDSGPAYFGSGVARLDRRTP